MLNQISIMGRLTKDPELRYTASNVPVCTFTAAVERDYAANGEKQTDFIDCVAWRQTGEFVSKYFSKGAMIAVTGRLESRRWEDRDGNKRTSWEINVDHAYFCGGKSEKRDDNSAFGNYRPPSNEPPPAKPPQFEDLGDDDGELPF